MAKENNESQGCFQAIVLVCFVLTIFYNFGEVLGRQRRYRHYPMSREKSCYANMRVIQGAIEMYNMDNTPMMTNVDLSKLTGTSGYLKSTPACPETTVPYTQNSDLTIVGKVICNIHGSVD